MATHSSILAWRTPWTEEPGRLWLVHRVAKSWTQVSQVPWSSSGSIRWDLSVLESLVSARHTAEIPV